MPRLRTFIIALGVAVLIMTAGVGALWFKYRDSITPDLRSHAQAVLTGQAGLLGERTPGELIRYAKRRLEGHPNLEAVALPPLHWLQRRYERPAPPGPLPTLGKGQQSFSLPPQQYGPTGIPLETMLPPQGSSTPVQGGNNAALAQSGAPGNQILVTTAAQLIQATNAARPGQTITLAPGLYRLNQRVNAAVAGSPQQPITLRAAQPGQARLEVDREGVEQDAGLCGHVLTLSMHRQDTAVKLGGVGYGIPAQVLLGVGAQKNDFGSGHLNILVVLSILVWTSAVVFGQSLLGEAIMTVGKATIALRGGCGHLPVCRRPRLAAWQWAVVRCQTTG